ncbi:MAG: RNA 3'-terminal phosphate cyclase [Candidatus Woesearchaeota archaeon]
MIELDGSYGEGGGQILRTALGLSIITQKPFRLKNIRQNRSEPGLKQQHVSSIKACAEFGNAIIVGNKIGSKQIEFVPRVIKNRQIEINIGTAGSIGLLFQSVMLPLIFTNSEIKIKGGTDVKWSMPIDYVMNVIKPILEPYCEMKIICEKRGYYPRGGGEVIFKTVPKFKRIDFDNFEKFHQFIFGNPALNISNFRKLMIIRGVSHASFDLQQNSVAERQAKATELMLRQHGIVEIERMYSKTESTGSGILLYAVFENNKRIGADVIGEKKIKSEEIGRMCYEKLEKILRQKIVDEHMQDNLIPLLGLFGGKIKVGEITMHTKSNIKVCEEFLGVEYNIENQSEANFISVFSSSTK